MKTILIKLAKKKGFKSSLFNLLDNFDAQIAKETSTMYYLWLCELQLWLEQKKRVIINPEFNFKSLEYDVYGHVQENENGQYLIRRCETRMQALECGCKKALELID